MNANCTSAECIASYPSAATALWDCLLWQSWFSTGSGALRVFVLGLEDLNRLFGFNLVL